jgi:hypothetical protein
MRWGKIKRAEAGANPFSALTSTPSYRRREPMADLNSTPSIVTYKTVRDFPNWMVGDDGSVWTFTNGGWYPAITRESKNGGYLSVVMQHGLIRRTVHTYTLILEAFVGPPPDGMMCCHAPDVDPANNALSNLRWGTGKDNAADLKKYGKNPKSRSAESGRRVKHPIKRHHSNPPVKRDNPPRPKLPAIDDHEREIILRLVARGITADLIAIVRGLAERDVVKFLEPKGRK